MRMWGLVWFRCRKRVCYERVTGVKVCFWFFGFTGLLLLLLLGSRRMLFSTGFLFALFVSLSEARCRLGFSRRIDAAIYRPAWKAKTRSQSSEHSDVSTRKHKHSSR